MDIFGHNINIEFNSQINQKFDGGQFFYALYKVIKNYDELFYLNIKYFMRSNHVTHKKNKQKISD